MIEHDRTDKQRPGRVHISTNIKRGLDRQLRAWARVDHVSMTSIIEAALEREFAHWRLTRSIDDNCRVNDLILRQRMGRKPL